MTLGARRESIFFYFSASVISADLKLNSKVNSVYNYQKVDFVSTFVYCVVVLSSRGFSYNGKGGEFSSMAFAEKKQRIAENKQQREYIKR